MIAFNHVVPVLNLSVFNVRRAPAFAFEQSKRATIGGRFIRVDESRDLPLLHVVEDFTQKPVCSFAVTTGGEIKIDSAAPAVDGPVQIRPAAIDLHVGFIHVPLALPEERAGLMAAFFVESYLAFSIPAILAGYFVGKIGLMSTANSYISFIILLSLVALLMIIKNFKNK
ncbi:transposase [Acinetobacter baumannii]|nr:transposase [Acinetobacter baumannii]